MAQSWHDLLFAHWPVPVADIRALVPEPLEVDTQGGQAWIGVVPFRMTGVRVRGIPAMPWLSAFPEMNVRTYVVLDGKPGVYFFSLDAANPLAVAGARQWFHLPYFNARMSLTDAAGKISYVSRRTGTSLVPAELRCSYHPTGDVFRSQPGTLEHWLTERYCLYVAHRHGIYRGDIHHLPWPLQTAEATFAINSMTRPLPLDLPTLPPLLHFARRLDVVVWHPRRVR